MFIKGARLAALARVRPCAIFTLFVFIPFITHAILHPGRALGIRRFIHVALVARREPRDVGVFSEGALFAGCFALCTLERANGAFIAHPALTGVDNILIWHALFDFRRITHARPVFPRRPRGAFVAGAVVAPVLRDVAVTHAAQVHGRVGVIRGIRNILAGVMLPFKIADTAKVTRFPFRRALTI